jgi:hypothetical protein
VGSNLLSSRIEATLRKPPRVNGTISPFVGDIKDLAASHD